MTPVATTGTDYTILLGEQAESSNNTKKGVVMKCNCHQTGLSAGIPPVSVCRGTVSAFQPSDSSFTGKVTGELSKAAERNCQSHIHTYITASTRLTQGYVIMISPYEWVSHAEGAFVCVCVWRMVQQLRAFVSGVKKLLFPRHQIS